MGSTSEKGKELHLHLNFAGVYTFSDSSGLPTTAYDTVSMAASKLISTPLLPSRPSSQDKISRWDNPSGRGTLGSCKQWFYTPF